MRSWHCLMVALGAVLWIIAFFLMIEGSILGERTTGIATLLGLMGMVIIIITTNALMMAKAKKPWKNPNGHQLQQRQSKLAFPDRVSSTSHKT